MPIHELLEELFDLLQIGSDRDKHPSACSKQAKEKKGLPGSHVASLHLDAAAKRWRIAVAIPFCIQGTAQIAAILHAKRLKLALGGFLASLASQCCWSVPPGCRE